jgi:hypothetical protein
MDIILKGKVTNANHDGSLWIKDWSKEPMPMYVFIFIINRKILM